MKTDKWLKETLKAYQPAPSIKSRSRFLEEAGAIAKANAPGFWRRYGAFVVIGLVSLTALLVYLTDGLSAYDAKKEISQAGKMNQGIGIVQHEEQPGQAQNSLKIQEMIFPDTEHNENLNSRSETSSKVSIEKQTAALENGKISQKSVASMHAINQNKTTILPAIGPMLLLSGHTKALNSNLNQPLSSPSSDSFQTKSNITLLPKEKTDQFDGSEIEIPSPAKYHRGRLLSFALFYRPEQIQNLIEVNKTAHNFGFRLTKQLFNGHYSIATGLGLSFSKGYYEYVTAYNEYLGTYNRLDSIGFAWDEKQYNLVPTYYTTPKQAFDDQVSINNNKVYKRHIYLQIPIVMGYDFYRKKAWSVGVVFGPRLSVLVDTKNLTFLPDNGLNRIVQINQITPDRIKTNWQLFGGMHVKYRTRHGLSIAVEPNINYYFNAVYEKADQQKAPWSAGLSIFFGFD